MKKRYFNGIRTVVLSGLMGLASFAHAEVAYNEQIISSYGGTSVSMDGEWLAVGAYDALTNTGCYVSIFRFDYAAMEWGSTPHTTLGKDNCTGVKGFGAALSLKDGELVVGLSKYKIGNLEVGAWSAYAYNSANGEWELLIGPIVADDPQSDSGFGTAVNIQDGILLIGAPQYDGNGTDTGKVYLYERPEIFTSTLLPTVTVEGNQTNSLFGSAVAGDREDILIGASSYDQGFIDNGAGFMYEYNASVPSLTLVGEVYGSAHDEKLGLQLEHTGTFAAIAGNLRSYGYRFNGSAWQRDLILEGTLGGDVDIVDNLGALAIKGSSVNLYPLLDKNLNSYFLPIMPTGTPSTEFAEDISLYQNHLVVSEFNSTQPQTRFYTMPCGYGGALTENEWSMVSIPCKITGQTVATIFGDDGLETYGTNWVVYEQNMSNYSGESADYVKLDEASPIEQGKSYWIIADANRTWKVDSIASSTHTDLNTTMAPNPDVVAGTYAIVLPTADQNVSGDIYAKVMVGNPFARSFEWTNVQYYSSVLDANITLADANTSGYMNSTAYVYDSSSTSGQPYTAVTTETPGVGIKTIPVNEGFWIKMLENAQTGDKLLIPLEK